MYSERFRQGYDSVAGPVRTSDRLRRRPKIFGRTCTYLYYNPMCTRARTAAFQIARMFGQDGLSSPVNKTMELEAKLKPRREGLRPRRSMVAIREDFSLESGDKQGSSEEKVGQDEMDNENETDAQKQAENKGKNQVEQEGRRRYYLRNRAEVRRLSAEETLQRPRSSGRVLQQGVGTKVGNDKGVRKGKGQGKGKRKAVSRAHSCHLPPTARDDDSDDSLLVDNCGIQTAGSSSKGGADIQPLHLQVDESVSFDDVGGLSEYVDALKEMVFLPLLYPSLYASFHITPSRGVLLCGPPGTGKTLIARALACTASKVGRKVSFYMCKGADVLSKWVGESERQLKLLFEEARRNQPSIIFFDEIDGLAPVRSSKQENTHNSIVSTLLVLMDGLDSRGQIVLIGATNRVDAIDGALRRPGRFDREFNFPLPSFEARAEILDIHTRRWKHTPSRELKYELSAACVGYCGADLKALCVEAAIGAFREKYPHVYTSGDKFSIDVDSVKVEKYHFIEAMATITPSAHRGAVLHSRPLSLVVAPCLQRHLRKAMNYISDIFPLLALSSELRKLSMLSYGSVIPLVHRPRLLLSGSEGNGVDHLGPAILHELEKFPVHSLALPALLSDPSAKTPEEALVHIFGEARRTTPSILYIPHFDIWWKNAHEQLRAVLLTLLAELPSDLPILLLGTSSVPLGGVEAEWDPSLVFPLRSVYQVEKPSTEDRSLFFEHLFEAASSVLFRVQQIKSSNAVEANDAATEMLDSSSSDGIGTEAFGLTEGSEYEDVKQIFIQRTQNYNIPRLERLFQQIIKHIFGIKDINKDDFKSSIFRFLLKFT